MCTRALRLVNHLLTRYSISPLLLTSQLRCNQIVQRAKNCQIDQTEQKHPSPWSPFVVTVTPPSFKFHSPPYCACRLLNYADCLMKNCRADVAFYKMKQQKGNWVFCCAWSIQQNYTLQFNTVGCCLGLLWRINIIHNPLCPFSFCWIQAKFFNIFCNIKKSTVFFRPKHLFFSAMTMWSELLALASTWVFGQWTEKTEFTVIWT